MSAVVGVKLNERLLIIDEIALTETIRTEISERAINKLKNSMQNEKTLKTNVKQMRKNHMWPPEEPHKPKGGKQKVKQLGKKAPVAARGAA